MLSPQSFNYARVVAKSDTVDIPVIEGMVQRAIYVGGAGDVTLMMGDNSTVLFTAVPVGTVLMISAKRIMSTGSTGPFTCLYQV